MDKARPLDIGGKRSIILICEDCRLHAWQNPPERAMHRVIFILVILVFPFSAAACTSITGQNQERWGYSQSIEQRFDLSNPTSVGPFKLDDRWSAGVIENDISDPTVQKAAKDAKKVLETNLELYYNSFGLDSNLPINYGLDGEQD